MVDADGANILQAFVFADEGRVHKLGLYARTAACGVRLDKGAGLPIPAGGMADLCTFFNAFSHRKWRDLTGLEDVALRLGGVGTVTIVIAVYVPEGAAWEIVRREVTLRGTCEDIQLPPLSTMGGELLGLHVHGGAADACLAAAAWVTRCPPRRAVSLAAVITTYGRERLVRQAMAGFAEHVCGEAPLGSVELYVIDNEGTLEPTRSKGLTIIRNPNLGGAGGFTRGLLEATDTGRFTHVLFMDDDATCEAESVRRTIALLAYLSDAKAAVAGAMLLADRPCIQHEKGALLDRSGRPQQCWLSNKHDKDLATLEALCDNERDDAVNYGGWWFFAFPLAAVEKLPFPFFVRGDDVHFSLSNGFPVFTLNGIATWCDGFGTKLGPATEYLTYRAWLALSLMHGTRKAARRTLSLCLKTAERCAYRFDYATMDAILEAVDDVMRGPEMFTDTPAPLRKLARLRSTTCRERPRPDDLLKLKPQRWGGRDRLIARSPFAGHLFSALSKRSKGVRHAVFAWGFDRTGLGGAGKAVFGQGLDLGVFTLDRSALLSGLLRIAKRRAHRFRIPSVQARYQAFIQHHVTRSYWEAQFRGEPAEPVPAAQPAYDTSTLA